MSGSSTQVVKNQLDRVLINHSSYTQKQKKKKTGDTSTTTTSTLTQPHTATVTSAVKSDSKSDQKSNISAYEEYRKSMGLPCNLITK